MADSGHLTREEYVVQQQAIAASTAERVVAGELSFLEGARAINQLGLDHNRDPDLDLLNTIDCEADALPIGPVASFWAADAIAAKADEIARVEQWARGFAPDVFIRLAARF